MFKWTNRPLKIFGGALVLLVFWFIYWGITPKNATLVFSIHQITPVSPLYYIRSAREFLQSQFVYGDEDSSYWNFSLASKRLDEANTLAKYNLPKGKSLQFKRAQYYQRRGVFYLNRLINVTDVNYLIKMRDDNQRILSENESPAD